MNPTRDHAERIWHAAVAAADPFTLCREAAAALPSTGRVLVVGGGKAGALMAAGVESALGERVYGLVNIPEGTARPLRQVQLVEARSAGSNHPTEAGVAGVERMLALVEQMPPGEQGLCLLSGGGSALLPAPAEGLTLVRPDGALHFRAEASEVHDPAGGGDAVVAVVAANHGG